MSRSHFQYNKVINKLDDLYRVTYKTFGLCLGLHLPAQWSNPPFAFMYC